MAQAQGQITVRQIRSVIGCNSNQRKVIQALGLGKISNERVHKDNNCIRGMINKVAHLVEYKLSDKK